jgi:hypothetical protein
MKKRRKKKIIANFKIKVYSTRVRLDECPFRNTGSLIRLWKKDNVKTEGPCLQCEGAMAAWLQATRAEDGVHLGSQFLNTGFLKPSIAHTIKVHV